MKIAAIIVAAGRSSRFGVGNKLLVDFGGRPLIRHAIAAADASPVRDIVIVIAPDGAAILEAAGAGRWRSVVNTRAHDGMASSIQTGLAAVPLDCDGALIMLADMPRVTAALIAELVSAFNGTGGNKIVFPVTASGVQGNPVLWPRALFAELNALQGDTGGKAVLAAHPELQHPVSVDDDAVRFDVDTQDDLAQAQARDA